MADSSILNDTKKILNIQEDFTAFDLDISTHINSTLSILNQLGVGPTGGFVIQGPEEMWGDLGLPPSQLNLVKTYIFLKVRMLFDPPSTSFHIEAMEKQITEHEQRISQAREELIPVPESNSYQIVEEEPVWG